MSESPPPPPRRSRLSESLMERHKQDEQERKDHHSEEGELGYAAAEADADGLIAEIEKLAEKALASDDAEAMKRGYKMPHFFYSKGEGLKTIGYPNKRVLTNSDAFIKGYGKKLQELLGEPYFVHAGSHHKDGYLTVIWSAKPKKGRGSHH